MPGHYKLLARLFNRSHGFHDLHLSGSVLAARHAVSVDEWRRTFPPTLWENLDELNGAGGGDYLQQWFPGDHGSVGGGGDIVGLSNISLAWVARDTARLGEYAEAEDMSVSLCNQSAPPGVLARLLRHNPVDRMAPHAPGVVRDVSEAARLRWRDTRSRYRPRPLRHLATDLDAPEPSEEGIAVAAGGAAQPETAPRPT
ncbi:DUF2235 domain-containing protein [Salipiger sp. HF18]|nr:DUF2235 domain-containing protein [Salipiger sp. HF18]